MPNTRLVVFADIDGAICDLQGRAFADAATILQPLKRDEVSIVLCSSRTRAEIEAIQQRLGIRHPFVCESGGAVFIPADYFGFNVSGVRDLAGYRAVEYGRPHAEVVEILHRTTARLGIDIVGFADMSVEEVAQDCQLPLLDARLAKLLEYGERFRLLDSNESSRSRLVKALVATRLRCVSGQRYDYVGAAVDASTGVNLLCRLYQYADSRVVMVGIGGGTADNTLPQLLPRLNMPLEDKLTGGVDSVSWVKTIVDAAEWLRRQESSRLGTVRSHR